ncbi:MAG TPA: hemerythrin domain-containing protein [Solirubrobacteraceae bacterium]|jgi:hemerythrin-like domain-containing protein
MSEYERLGVTPTPDDGTRLSEAQAWDESTRPHREQSGADVQYSEQGRQVGKHLIDVHDMLRRELDELHNLLGQVRDGALDAGDARSALNEMAMRQNDWTLGAFCARYCHAVARHHGLEDAAVFPHLAQSDASLAPVIDRLAEEHLAIHDAIERVDGALVAHINDPDDFEPLQRALDLLTDALLSHLSYEEHELVEPLARLGFYAGQL